MSNVRCFVSSVVILLFSVTCCAQFKLYDTISYQKKKLTALTIAAGTVYTTGMIGLNELWYKENPRQSFHFFNDNHEWKQVDKVGHFSSAFYLSSVSAKTLNLCGVNSKKSAFIGSLAGFGSLLTIEILDGYSAAYGASVGDLLANAGGSAFYWSQQAAWNEVRIYPKFSFHRTSYAPLRPNVLGSSLATEFFKDYNGQTYWLSVDMDKFCRFPKWLNIAVGYGAQGMVYARDVENRSAGFNSYRQYYLSLDLDLRDIPSRYKTVRALLAFASLLKFPAPSLELTNRGVKFHPLYF